MSKQSLQSMAYMLNPGLKQAPPLPAISSKRSDDIIKKVRDYIEEEEEKSKCNRTGFDPLRFIIYKRAFDMLIDDMTVYKDLMADIKREYEDCINTIESGSEETLLLKNKVDSLSVIKPTMAGYQQRKIDLIRKLETLNKANALLERQIKEVEAINEDEARKREEKKEKTEGNEQEEVESVDIAAEEIRPIPGLPVADWTNARLLQSVLLDIKQKVEQQADSKVNKYVELREKYLVQAMIRKRLGEQEEAAEQLEKLHETEKELDDAFLAIKDKLLNNENHSAAMEIYKKVHGSGAAGPSEGQEGLEMNDDDPWSNKEADVLLEYCNRFLVMFETSYEQAAIHAAYSPRNILRHMKVFNMFRKASEGWRSSPSPLLLFVHAMANSSTASNGKLDREMSIESVRCILNENHPEVMQNWINTGGFTFCCEIGHMFLEYSKKQSEHRVLCLDVALRMFLYEEDHHYVCVALYQLGQFERLFNYANVTARFRTADYLKVIVLCESTELLWMFYHPGRAESFTHECVDSCDYHTESESRLQCGLPIRMDEAICALIDSGAEETALTVLEGLYKKYADKKSASKRKLLKQRSKGKKKKLTPEEQQAQQEIAAAERNEFQTGEFASLDQIPYYELEHPIDEHATVEADEVSWSRIAKFTRDQERPHLELEIRTALFVKSSILRTVMEMEFDERSQFDYYK